MLKGRGLGSKVSDSQSRLPLIRRGRPAKRNVSLVEGEAFDDLGFEVRG